MSNGQACFQIEDRSPADNADASPPASGVRDTESTIHVVDGRSTAATVPGAGVDRFAATMPVVEEAPVSVTLPFEWCVDLGAMMVTRTTFELWAAIERGEVRGRMLVWREGMECWTPVEHVGELVCALERAPSVLPEATPEPAEATTNPELRRPAVDPPRASSRRRVPVRGGKWIALGSAVAASAISAAALTTLLAQPPASAPSGMREPAAAPMQQGENMSRNVPTMTLIEPATVSVAPSRPRHEDRGQHRRRVGDRR